MKTKQGFSKIVVKSINEDSREFVGIASSVSADRDEDVLVPEGARFTLPMPLLWMHDHNDPVGEIYEAEVIEGGEIKVKGRLASVDEPAFLRERLNEAWAKLKALLVRGLSVGFRPVEWSFIDGSNGMKFTAWDWYETSLVTIPANADATLSIIKKYGTSKPAASGTKAKGEPFKIGPSRQTKSPKGNDMEKQIKQFRDSLKDLREQRQEIVKAANDEGRTLDHDEQEKFDALSDQIKSVTDHIKRLEALQDEEADNAEPVDNEAGKTTKAASAVRTNEPRIVTSSRPVEKGIAFAQYAKLIGITKGNLFSAESLAVAKAKEGAIDKRVLAYVKAAVAAASTGNASWAGNLVHESNIVADFVEFLRPMTILGQFGTGNIPSLTRVPANVPIDIQTTGGSAQWVGEGKAKPLTSWSYGTTSMPEFKVATIAAVTQELLRNASSSADQRIRDELARAIAARLDTDFIDPTKALVAGVSPASITNGATTQASAGIEADITFLIGTLIAASIPLSSVVFIMSSANAFALSRKRDPLGNYMYPEMGITGGAIDGVPVIVSDYAGTNVVAAVASEIYLVDEDGLAIDMSDQASLEMADNPTGSSVATVTPATLVSMWQTNSVAFRAERYINWARRRAAAVAYVTDADYSVDPDPVGP